MDNVITVHPQKQFAHGVGDGGREKSDSDFEESFNQFAFNVDEQRLGLYETTSPPQLENQDQKEKLEVLRWPQVGLPPENVNGRSLKAG